MVRKVPGMVSAHALLHCELAKPEVIPRKMLAIRLQGLCASQPHSQGMVPGMFKLLVQIQPVRAALTQGPSRPEMGGVECITLKSMYFSNQVNQEDADV